MYCVFFIFGQLVHYGNIIICIILRYWCFQRRYYVLMINIFFSVFILIFQLFIITGVTSDVSYLWYIYFRWFRFFCTRRYYFIFLFFFFFI
eukprot:UN05483